MSTRPLRPIPLVCAAIMAGCSGAPQEPLAAKGDAPPRASATLPEPPAVLAVPEPPEEKAKGNKEDDKSSPPPVVDKRPRLAAIGDFAWIYKKPEAKGLALGYVRMGTSVPLKSTQRIEGKGCGRGFYAVEPRGYVCLNHATTLDVEDPYFKALQEIAPTKDAVWYFRYAFSNGAPMYSRVPTKEEQDKEDKKFGPRRHYVQLAEWSKNHEELIINDPITATDPVPAIFAGGKRLVGGGPRDPRRLLWRVIPNGSMLAYAKAFEEGGRVWLVTPDLMIVPADRVRIMRRSTFHGVPLGSGVELPLAWNRTKGLKPKYKRAEGGKLERVADVFPAKSWVAIEDTPTKIDGKTYYPVKGDASTLIEEGDVTISRAKATLPKGVNPGDKWIEAKILPGTLTLYEGTKPVYATLFSPGKGGVPGPGMDNTKYSTTSIGFFPIEWKDHVATMTPDKGEPKVLWFTDVPHIQYLKAPLAMHVAYWHEDFGNPKSAECVNLAPEDGRFIFNWTDPVLPEGWGGMRPGDGNGRSTPVVITAR